MEQLPDHLGWRGRGQEEQLTARSSRFEQRTPPASCGDFFVFSNAVTALEVVMVLPDDPYG